MHSPKLESQTPILDLLEPLPVPFPERRSNRSLYFWLTLLAFACVTGNAFVPFFLLWAVCIWWLKVAVHEFGHLLAGSAVGLRFNSVAIGSIWLVREEHSLKFRWKRQIFMGQVNMGLERLRRARRRLAILSLGGPIATIISALAALSLPIMFSSRLGDFAPGFVDFSIYAFVIVSVFSFVISLRPRFYGTVPNDILMAKILLTSPPEAKRIIATYALHLQIVNGVDQINVNRRWEALSRSGGSAPWTEYCQSWELYASTLHDNSQEAAAYLEKCLAASAILQEEQRDHLICEAAYFSAMQRKDVFKAEKWLARCSKESKIHIVQILRVRTAIELAKRNSSAAIAHCDKALHFLRSIPQGLRAREEESSWTSWRETIEQEHREVVV